MKLHELRQKRDAAGKELPGLVADLEKYEAKKREIVELDAMIVRAVEAEEIARNGAVPVGTEVVEGAPVVPAMTAARTGEESRIASMLSTVLIGQRNASAFDPTRHRAFESYVSQSRASDLSFDPTKRFASFGEYLQSVVRASVDPTRAADNRLVRAPTGAGEVDPTTGGFLVQVDFASAIFTLAHDMGELLARVNKLPISSNASGIKIPAVDETSRVNGSRWGGVASSWVDEGTTVTATKPKFRVIELSLKKLMSTMYMTDELLQDSTALTAIASQAFAEEIMFMTEDAIFEGSGAGQPQGFMNSGALVTVAKEVGQAAGTIVLENVLNMYARMWSRSRKNSVWLINQDAETWLNRMGQTVGTGGLPVYVPGGTWANSPNTTLLGRPVIANEYSNALGTSGDIALVDLSQYLLADKGGVSAATSMHVAFLSDQMVFRITYRVDGRPIWTKPITPFKGSLTKSPFIALANR